MTPIKRWRPGRTRRRRTSNSACTWIAEATVVGRAFTARSRHGAPNGVGAATCRRRARRSADGDTLPRARRDHDPALVENVPPSLTLQIRRRTDSASSAICRFPLHVQRRLSRSCSLRAGPRTRGTHFSTALRGLLLPVDALGVLILPLPFRFIAFGD